ncbi:cysteine desulfurase [Palleronia marisminoris]|uniref:Cysteine desulfurase n=1 Tax=Palleronia marisminoris TaxID=315423 RepID=A0A1Y5R738_9RHOB|nr:aminotransferase class V-fold PLP-dependent enzyme [Palleronia marisminoris]SFG06256.1 cysteine desulfurase [Palleronia marisminoris]SLN10686.1 Cysteine desulfurase [Palleronia marisminoris]
MQQRRTYLDWNATAPLRPEAREAMVAAMDLAGNPSSIHAEGRAARAAVERARTQIAEALGAQNADIVFVSGATEAAAMACADRGLLCAPVEHEAVLAWCDPSLPVDAQGRVTVAEPGRAAVQAANSETGVVQDLPDGLAVVDATQAFGKIPFAFEWSGADMAFVSAHKIGGPKGIGALILRRGLDIAARARGGGQEMGRRAGTENVAAIAGFGAAAEAAAADLAGGVWKDVAARRDYLEYALMREASGLICVGKDASRLPNTSLLVTPGWKGETQVMQMDLAGFAVSAGSACSSGKLRGSGTLAAMGMDPDAAGSAIRVSLGPTTTDEDVSRFAEAWLRQWNKHRARAA